MSRGTAFAIEVGLSIDIALVTKVGNVKRFFNSQGGGIVTSTLVREVWIFQRYYGCQGARNCQEV